MLGTIQVIICEKCGVVFSTDKAEKQNETGSFLDERYICPACKHPNDNYYIRDIVTDDDN